MVFWWRKLGFTPRLIRHVSHNETPRNLLLYKAHDVTTRFCVEPAYRLATLEGSCTGAAVSATHACCSGLGLQCTCGCITRALNKYG